MSEQRAFAAGIGKGTPVLSKGAVGAAVLVFLISSHSYCCLFGGWDLIELIPSHSRKRSRSDIRSQISTPRSPDLMIRPFIVAPFLKLIVPTSSWKRLFGSAEVIALAENRYPTKNEKVEDEDDCRGSNKRRPIWIRNENSTAQTDENFYQ